MTGSLQEIVRILQQCSGCYDKSGFSESEIVLTGTGFIHDERQAIRQLSALLGIRYCGDLANKYTTHLVVASSPTTHNHSAKMLKAWEWEIPVVTVQWLLDSIDAGNPLSCNPYIIPNPAKANDEEQQRQHPPLPSNKPKLKPTAEANTTAQQQTKRPSSVASNVHKAQQSPRNYTSPAVKSRRSPLGVVNAVAGMLRSMSISPAPAPAQRPVESSASPIMLMESSPAYHHKTHRPSRLGLSVSSNEEEELCGDSVTADEVAAIEASVGGQSSGSVDSEDMQDASNSSPDIMSIGPSSLSDEGSSQEASKDSPMQVSPHPNAQSMKQHPTSTTLHIQALPDIQPTLSPEVLPLSAQPRSSPHRHQTPSTEVAAISPSSTFRGWNTENNQSYGEEIDGCDAHSALPEIQGEGAGGNNTPQSASGSALALGLTEETPLALTQPFTQLQNMIIPPTEIHQRAPTPKPEVCVLAGAALPLSPVLDCTGAENCVGQQAEEQLVNLTCSPPREQKGEEAEEKPVQYAEDNLCDLPDFDPPQYESEQHQTRQEQQQQPCSTSQSGWASIRDWTDDDISDDEKNGPSITKRKIHTGLTQIPNPVIARTKASSLTVGAGIIEDDDGGVLVGKVLLRPPRGTTVKEAHGLANLKSVKYTEQVCVKELGISLSTKDKKTVVQVPALDIDDPSESGTSSGNKGMLGALLNEREQDVWLGEVQTIYKLSNGKWHVEFCRFYTGSQAERCAAAAGKTFALPYGYNRTNELLKSCVREHCALSDITGTNLVRKVKTGGPVLQLRGAAGRSHFWRSGVDPEKWMLLTDRPVTDFLLSQ